MSRRIGSGTGHTGQRVLAYTDSLLSHFERSEAAHIPNLAKPISHNQQAVGEPIPNPQPLISNLVESLTDRELEILRLIAAGHSNQGIADTLVIAVSTAKRHINNIYGKLDVQSRTQALLRARELDLL